MKTKTDIIHDCCTDELFMVKRAKLGTTLEIYPTWQAVCIGLWIKVKLRIQSLHTKTKPHKS
jgi:hypothetical protein